jgi:hypothetical protein
MVSMVGGTAGSYIRALDAPDYVEDVKEVEFRGETRR